MSDSEEGTMATLREGLPELPARFRKLPLDPRGYPIPWFVAEVEGKRDFRVADGAKRVRAVRERLCWLCGEKLGVHMAFVIGPMCAVNRNTSEPGCHLECAEFAAKACPFLTLPDAKYRTANLPEGGTAQPHALGGNPGVVCIWVTRSCRPYKITGGWLIRVGAPSRTIWYTGGRLATRVEVLEGLDARLPLLASIAKEEGSDAEAALRAMVEVVTRTLLPAAEPVGG